MIQIRKGIFETNSSSTHVLSISFKDSDMEFPEKITVYRDGTFGWDNTVFYDTNSKITYLYLITDGEESDEWKKIVAYLNIINVTVAFQKGINIYGGWIDHGSEAIPFLETLINTPDLLYNFLFNDKSFIQTGNDNDDEIYNQYMDPDKETVTDAGWNIPGDYTFVKGN